MIGIFGGTFDPVHYGHLRPALEVMQSLGLEEMRFVPNRVPPHRDPPWLDERQRTRLLEVAVREQSGFTLDRREVERDGPSWMVDTLLSLKQELSPPLCLVLGVDAFLGLPQWHQWERIPELAHLVVTTRPGFVLKTELIERIPVVMAESPAELASQEAGRILIQSVTQLDISSSLIREQLRKGGSVRYLLPEAVNQQLVNMVKN